MLSSLRTQRYDFVTFAVNGFGLFQHSHLADPFNRDFSPLSKAPGKGIGELENFLIKFWKRQVQFTHNFLISGFVA